MRANKIVAAAQLAHIVATQGQTVDRIVNNAADRAEDVADFLEEIDNNIKEEHDD